MFKYYISLKSKGLTAREIATELESQGQLGPGKSLYLTTLLKSLGFGLESIIRTVYAVYPGKELGVESHANIKEGAKSKTYSVTIKSCEHAEQKAFQETEHFKEKAKER